MEEQHSQRKLRDEEVRRREAAVAQARDSEQQASAAKQQLAPRAPADAETRGDGELQVRSAKWGEGGGVSDGSVACRSGWHSRS